MTQKAQQLVEKSLGESSGTDGDSLIPGRLKLKTFKTSLKNVAP